MSYCLLKITAHGLSRYAPIEPPRSMRERAAIILTYEASGWQKVEFIEK